MCEKTSRSSSRKIARCLQGRARGESIVKSDEKILSRADLALEDNKELSANISGSHHLSAIVLVPIL